MTWFLDEDTEEWHLVHHFRAVPMPPRDEPASGDAPFAEANHVCVGHTPRIASGLFDYMVDAHSGAVVFYFASTPHIDVPAPMTGADSGGNIRNFFGLSGGGAFLLSDPIRNLSTFDLQHQDLDATPTPAVPATPITNATNNFGTNFPAAVAAHYHATLVHDFYNDVLKRNSIDDNGMAVVSVVNAYASSQNPLPPPSWLNAVWWNKTMWYGEVNGVSLAEHLDVIGHELTHGVTESTSNLIYRRLSGALNESFSDVFGVIIANWYPSQPEPLVAWDWRIGAGLAPNGRPLRDFANPAAEGQPDHFAQYVVLPIQNDNGGVHIYSGIHNKAVHLLLTNTDGSGTPTFPLQEAVLLLYLTLTRLTPTSDFRDCRRTLENVVQTFHISDPATANARMQAIDAAYGAVGIV